MVLTKEGPVVSDFRADQVGSLLRPRRLLEAWGQFFSGKLDRAALTEIQEESILAALEGQRSAGIDVYTDGEFRRAAYMSGLTDAVDGFSFVAGGQRLPWRSDPGREVPPEIADFSLPVVTERIRSRGRVAGADAAFLREHAPGPFKVTLPSPAHFAGASYRPGVSDEAYPNRSDFVRDVASILADEAETLAREGTPYVQVDSPTYSGWLEGSALAGSPGFEREDLAAAISGDNAILDRARAAGAVTAAHICRGNGSGAWLASGGYEPIAEQVFSELRCDRLLLEYDNDRSGGFEPLRLVPEPKMAVLGLVTTKYGELESRDELLKRIDEASRSIPVERLALSPQCGFASTFQGNPITESEQWRKLELVASVAREVWG
jgi:5-methyltetrahydropteroyltriglutamate--homocysteine methyltransferase